MESGKQKDIFIMEPRNKTDTSAMESGNQTDILLFLLALILIAIFLYYFFQKKKPKTKIDLHGMTVDQAITEVDKLLDDGIIYLRSCYSGKTNSLKMTIITGRGKHSRDGIPRIKIAVQGRLRKRQLSNHFWEINPGCLGVSIRKDSYLTDDVIAGIYII